MKRSEWIALAGIVTPILGGLGYIIFSMGGLTEKVITIEKSVERLEVQMKNMDDRVDEINTKVDILWRDRFGMNTPIKQIPIDKEALEKTKVGMFVKDHYKEILEQVKSVKPDNSRQAESALISVVIDFGKNHNDTHKLDIAAFENGYDLDSLLIMASMTIRARVIADLSL
jgi:hypothetical protein